MEWSAIVNTLKCHCYITYTPLHPRILYSLKLIFFQKKIKVDIFQLKEIKVDIFQLKKIKVDIFQFKKN